MKIFLVTLLLFLFQSEDCLAQKIRAGWFVADDYFGEMEEENEQTVENTDEEIVEQIKEEPEEEIKEESVETNEELIVDQNRFVLHNKDLDLANQWLKYTLKEDSLHNIVISPLSMYSVSLLLVNGVVDETLFNFSKLFSVMRLADANKKLARYLQLKTDTFSMYTSLWGKSFSEHYQKQIKGILEVEIWGLQGTTEPINNWINIRTNGVVSKIAPTEKTTDEDIFAVGYIAFDKESETLFDSKQVQEQEFDNLDGRKSKVMMMNQEKAVVDYYENEQMQAVRLFYKTGDYVTFFLPKAGVLFTDFVENLDINLLKPRFKKTEISLSIPKLDMEYKVSLAKDVYKMFDVTKIFERGNYDFAKMVSYDVPVHVEDVFLKAKFKLTESANAEQEAVKNESQEKEKDDSEKISFQANKPFVFMVNNGDLIGAYVKGESLLRVK